MRLLSFVKEKDIQLAGKIKTYAMYKNKYPSIYMLANHLFDIIQDEDLGARFTIVELEIDESKLDHYSNIALDKNNYHESNLSNYIRLCSNSSRENTVVAYVTDVTQDNIVAYYSVLCDNKEEQLYITASKTIYKDNLNPIKPDNKYTLTIYKDEDYSAKSHGSAYLMRTPYKDITLKHLIDFCMYETELRDLCFYLFSTVDITRVYQALDEMGNPTIRELEMYSDDSINETLKLLEISNGNAFIMLGDSAREILDDDLFEEEIKKYLDQNPKLLEILASDFQVKGITHIIKSYKENFYREDGTINPNYDAFLKSNKPSEYFGLSHGEGDIKKALDVINSFDIYHEEEKFNERVDSAIEEMNNFMTDLFGEDWDKSEDIEKSKESDISNMNLFGDNSNIANSNSSTKENIFYEINKEFSSLYAQLVKKYDKNTVDEYFRQKQICNL